MDNLKHTCLHKLTLESLPFLLRRFWFKGYVYRNPPVSLMYVSSETMVSIGYFPLKTIWQSPFSSVQSLSCVWLFAVPWTAIRQASLSITNSQSLLKLMSTPSVKPSNHLILCRPLLLPTSILLSIRVFSNESVLCIRWPKYWSFTFSNSLSNEYSGLISFRIDWFDLLAVLISFRNDWFDLLAVQGNL